MRLEVIQNPLSKFCSFFPKTSDVIEFNWFLCVFTMPVFAANTHKCSLSSIRWICESVKWSEVCCCSVCVHFNGEQCVPLWINRVYFDYATLCRMCFLTCRNVGRCPFSFLCCTLNNHRVKSSRICYNLQSHLRKSLLFIRYDNLLWFSVKHFWTPHQGPVAQTLILLFPCVLESEHLVIVNSKFLPQVKVLTYN